MMAQLKGGRCGYFGLSPCMQATRMSMSLHVLSAACSGEILHTASLLWTSYKLMPVQSAACCAAALMPSAHVRPV